VCVCVCVNAQGRDSCDFSGGRAENTQIRAGQVSRISDLFGIIVGRGKRYHGLDPFSVPSLFFPSV